MTIAFKKSAGGLLAPSHTGRQNRYSSADLCPFCIAGVTLRARDHADGGAKLSHSGRVSRLASTGHSTRRSMKPKRARVQFESSADTGKRWFFRESQETIEKTRLLRANDTVQQQGGLEKRNALESHHARPVCNGWFGLIVAPARLRFILYSSPDGSYIPGTGMSFRRR